MAAASSNISNDAFRNNSQIFDIFHFSNVHIWFNYFSRCRKCQAEYEKILTNFNMMYSSNQLIKYFQCNRSTLLILLVYRSLFCFGGNKKITTQKHTFTKTNSIARNLILLKIRWNTLIVYKPIVFYCLHPFHVFL